MMSSLRARLFAGLALLVLATGIIAGGFSYHWAFDEAIELQDSLLLQIGEMAMTNRVQSDSAPPGAVDADARVLIEELGSASTIQAGTNPIARLPDGLHSISRDGERWRLLVRTRPDGSRIATGQPTASRDEIAQDSALRAVLPLAALIPCLMLLIGFVIRQTFQPVARLAAGLDAKTSDHLAPLPLDGIPAELSPFIASINRLLDRIRALFEQQGRFIADAAHELRTPITALSLQADNLDRPDLPTESRERLATLRTGIRRTGHLLEQLLTFARYDIAGSAAAPETAVDDVVKQVVADVLPLAQLRSIDLGFAHIEPVKAHVEATALAIVIRNLVDNAVRHSGDGGRVDLSLSRDGDHARLLVEDTGPGITEAELARIFEPFYRGREVESDGSGLGLAIVHRILDGIGGSITLENIAKPGHSGLRAIVIFPLVCRV